MFFYVLIILSATALSSASSQGDLNTDGSVDWQDIEAPCRGFG